MLSKLIEFFNREVKIELKGEKTVFTSSSRSVTFDNCIQVTFDKPPLILSVGKIEPVRVPARTIVLNSVDVHSPEQCECWASFIKYGLGSVSAPYQDFIRPKIDIITQGLSQPQKDLLKQAATAAGGRDVVIREEL